MNRMRVWLPGLIMLLVLGVVQAGMRIEVRDPRYFERPHEVIFPHAEVKLVTYEFAAAEGDERGKARAKELHEKFLAKIHDLRGGAILTFITPKGQQINSYRLRAENFARSQQAQMALWGRIMVTDDGETLINARLSLLEPPAGVSAVLDGETRLNPDGPVMPLHGVIDAPVTQTRIDFSTMGDDVTPLADFLSGLARYYKGAAREKHTAVRWLGDSIAGFEAFIAAVDEAKDASALAQAHLYLARAAVRLSDADPTTAEHWLEVAAGHVTEAARLNPYDADVPPVQAVVAARRGASADELAGHLRKAVRLAPGDPTMRLNLAVVESAEGKGDAAIRQLDSASYVQKVKKEKPSGSLEKLRTQLKELLKFR